MALGKSIGIIMIVVFGFLALMIAADLLNHQELLQDWPWNTYAYVIILAVCGVLVAKGSQITITGPRDWDPEEKEVDVRQMIVYSFFPVANIYAAWRVQAYWKMAAIHFLPLIGLVGLIFLGPLVGFSIIFGIFLFSTLVFYFIGGPIFQWYFGRKYNMKIKNKTMNSDGMGLQL